MSILDDFRSQLSDAEDALASLVSGATLDDVASGAVDVSKLSRPDKAALHIDGKIPGTFDPANPWSVALDFGIDITAEAHSAGGVAFIISVDAPQIDVIESKAIPVRYAFLWDDEVIAEQGTISLDFVGKTFLVVRVADVPAGQRLTLWRTDNDVVFQVVKSGRADEINAFRQEVFGAVGAAASNPLDALQASIGQFFDVQKAGIVALVIMALVAGYVVLKTDGAVLKHLE